MKQFKICSMCVLLVLVFLCGCSNSVNTVRITPEIDDAVAQAILKDNDSNYSEGECSAEGHIIYGAELKNNRIHVYSYIDYAWFGFQNGNFVDVSGGSMPAVFELNADDYSVIKVNYPQGGENYGSSIEKLFSKKYVNKALYPTVFNRKNLDKQLNKYAENYLKSINREAVIGRMADFDYILPTDLGVSVEVSNSLLELERDMGYCYPYWIGNQEFIENGIRYVYALDYDKEKNLLIYSKYEYSKPKVLLEKFVVDSLTGKIVQ